MPDTFTEVFGLPRVENLEFEFSDVGMLNLDAIWDGEVQCNKAHLKDRANLLWAIGIGKTINLPRKMFVVLCAAYDSYDPRDLTRIELEKPIERYSLTQSEGQRKKRKLDEGTLEQPLVGIPELQEAIANLRVDFDTHMTTHDELFSRLEDQSGRHTTLLQEIKGMLIQMQVRNDDDDEEDD
ncbi:hypothetical protein Acr_00g0069520 [Actinidia rufa]|uniref:Uncharacterized protein n=1 Tax=Actinidia rufa TaxID=165716 RepID=A0A7J0DSE0_9ERIC|nr:hypothetical protein Acr_00g0069520 [Actinidia rufa]